MAHLLGDYTAVKKALIGAWWKIATLITLAGCIWLGWFLYELARGHRFDNVFGEWFRTLLITVQVAFRLDPVLTLIFFPLGILVVLILVGLLIWLQKDR